MVAEDAVIGNVSLPKPFASGDASEWFTRFEICSNANEWSDDQKALKLPTLLEGEALAVWLKCSDTEKKNYGQAKAKITKPPEFVSLEQFHQRKIHPGESISIFGHELKKLLNQAMPNLAKEAKEQLLLHQFLVGLPPAVSRQLRAIDSAKFLEGVLQIFMMI